MTTGASEPNTAHPASIPARFAPAPDPMRTPRTSERFALFANARVMFAPSPVPTSVKVVRVARDVAPSSISVRSEARPVPTRSSVTSSREVHPRAREDIWLASPVPTSSICKVAREARSAKAPVISAYPPVATRVISTLAREEHPLARSLRTE